MSIGEIRRISVKQLQNFHFRAISVLCGLIFAKLFFVIVRIAAAMFLQHRRIAVGFELAVAGSFQAFWVKMLIAAFEFLFVGIFFSRTVSVFCSDGHMYDKSFRIFLNICVLKVVLFFVKLPSLTVAFSALMMAKKILNVYNASSEEFMIMLLLWIIAACLYLAYLYFLLGMFPFFYLSANSENPIDAVFRSLAFMRKKRGRLFKLVLSGLPYAFTLRFALFAMRLAVFAKYCAHDLYDGCFDCENADYLL